MDVNPSSFEAYEGIRILVPGAIAVSIYAGLVSTYQLNLASPAANALGAIVAALLAGLVLRFIDFPSRSAAYKNPYLPHRELRTWGIDVKPYGRYTTLYFVILDVSFPATIRNRGLYMGSMFRIAFEGIYLVGLASLGVLALAAAFPDLGPVRGGAGWTRVVLCSVASAYGATLIYALVRQVRYKRAAPADREKPVIPVRNELPSDIGRLGIGALVVALCAVVGFAITKEGFLALAAVSLPATLWARLYLVGVPDEAEPGQSRRPLSPPAAVLLYGAAGTAACVCTAFAVDSSATFDTTTAAVWSLLTLVPTVLMADPGHERVLVGSFQTHLAWLQNHQDEIIEAHRLRGRWPTPAKPQEAAADADSGSPPGRGGS
jgi:hypothetical protein